MPLVERGDLRQAICGRPVITCKYALRRERNQRHADRPLGGDLFGTTTRRGGDDQLQPQRTSPERLQEYLLAGHGPSPREWRCSTPCGGLLSCPGSTPPGVVAVMPWCLPSHR